jgi:hypothetical protein
MTASTPLSGCAALLQHSIWRLFLSQLLRDRVFATPVPQEAGSDIAFCFICEVSNRRNIRLAPWILVMTGAFERIIHVGNGYIVSRSGLAEGLIEILPAARSIVRNAVLTPYAIRNYLHGSRER